MDRYRRVSLWLDTLPAPLIPRAGLAGDTRADVAIVGAGLTGLWTAYHLQRLEPGLKIVLVEREIAGFGASGRNGGWCSALFPASFDKIAAAHTPAAARAMRDAMRDTVDRVGADAAAEGIDCDFHKGGTLSFAFGAAQTTRARAEVEAARTGVGDDDLTWLSAAQTAAVSGAAGADGATFTPHCAALNPAKLVRGLADAVERRGAIIAERTAAIDIAPHRVVTDAGLVQADAVIDATEAFRVDLPGKRRDVIPVYSLIVATEPLPDAVLAEVGLADRPTFSDGGHVLCYGQRTADGRIVFGGRGAPYHFGSRLGDRFDRDGRVFSRLQHQITEMFPALAGARFTHAWGGAVAAPRDWHASVAFDPATGLGSAGGYVGDGVSTTHLAGRTLADLVTGSDTALTALPWVGHRSPRWEVEPLRWLGINAGIAVMTVADRAEARTGRPSRAAKLFGRLLGE